MPVFASVFIAFAREDVFAPHPEPFSTEYFGKTVSVDPSGFLLPIVERLSTGVLVHVPHADFARIFGKIAAALKDGGLVLITLKEGADRAVGADGRVFYLHRDSDLRRTFAALGFDVLDFSRDVSRLGTGEIWLGYLLKKVA